MSSLAHRVGYTFAEYLALEASSPIRHEYWDGNIYAMAGGSPAHAALATMLAVQLGAQLRSSPCRPFGSDLRVRVPGTGLDTYPDLSVICGSRAVDPDDKHAVNNPTLLVEVLSDSSETYDRGDKFEHYKRLTSLREYVLVSQRERCVEVFTRTPDDAWSAAVYRDGAVAKLSSIGARLDVKELYDDAEEPAA